MMKKQLMLLGLLALTNAGFAQSAWTGTTTTGNTSRTGNVGIGNTSPAKSLDILTGTANDGIMIKQTTSGHATLRMDNGSTGGHNYGFCSSGSGSTEGAGHFLLYDYTSNQYRLFFSNTGYLGLNNSSPAFKLDITTSTPSDGIRITQNSAGASGFELNNTTLNGRRWALYSLGNGDAAGSGNFAIYDQTSSTNRFFINGSNGNIGIGTTSPSQKLDVNGNINTSGILTVGSSFVIDPVGPFKNSAWAGTGDRVMLSDATGKISPLAQGLSTQVLYGNGTWGNLPASAFTNSGSDLNLPTGRLGIGISSPGSALDVNGDATIRGNLKANNLAGTGDRILYVDGTGNLKVMPVNSSAPVPCVQSSIPWYEGGNTNPANNTVGTCGPVDFILKANGNNALWIKQDAKVGIGNSAPSVQLDVTGSSRVSTNIEIGTAPTDLNPLVPLNITQGGSQNDGIRVIAQSGGRGAFEVVQTSSQSNSRFKIFADGSTYIGNFPSLAYVAGAPLLTVGGDVRFTAYGTGNANGNGIEILGGNKAPFRRGISTGYDNVSGEFNFYINSNQINAAYNFYNNTGDNVTPNLSNLMTLAANGRLSLGIGQNSSSQGNAQLNVNVTDNTGDYTNSNAIDVYDYTSGKVNFRVKDNGNVFAREVTVQLTNFPDYVFKANYKLMPLNEVETYVNKNNHLPNVPAAKDIEAKGANLGEIQKANIEKTEELFLYLFELNKRVQSLEKENKELKQKVARGK